MVLALAWASPLLVALAAVCVVCVQVLLPVLPLGLPVTEARVKGQLERGARGAK